MNTLKDLEDLAKMYGGTLVFEMVNEDGEIYDSFTEWDEAVSMIANYPNDSISIRIL